MNTTFKGELQLMNWGESSNSGAWVKFWLSPEDLEMFRSLKCRSGKIAGHRMAAVLVEIGDNDQPIAQVEHPKPKGRELARLAGMWCNDEKFIEWVHDYFGEQCYTSDNASEFIRATCDISSRAELDNNDQAAEKFHRLIRIPYSQWLKDR